MLALILFFIILVITVLITLYFLGFIENTVPYKKRELRKRDDKQKEVEDKEKENKDNEEKQDNEEKEDNKEKVKEEDQIFRTYTKEQYSDLNQDKIVYPYDKYPLLNDSCKRGVSNTFGVKGISAQTYSDVEFVTIKNNYNCVQPDMIKLD